MKNIINLPLVPSHNNENNSKDKMITLTLTPSIPASSLNLTESYKGVESCNKCKGRGYITHHRTCKSCVRKTGNCNVCKNTGMIIDLPGKKCKCIWAKDR